MTLQGATEGEPAQDVEGEMKKCSGGKGWNFLGENVKKRWMTVTEVEKFASSVEEGRSDPRWSGWQGGRWSLCEIGKVGRREESLVKCDMR